VLRQYGGDLTERQNMRPVVVKEPDDVRLGDRNSGRSHVECRSGGWRRSLAKWCWM